MAWRASKETLKRVGEGRETSLVRVPQVKAVAAGNLLIPSGMSGRAIFTNWSTEQAVLSGYKASTWVYACITKRMKAVASVPLLVQKFNSSSELWEEAPEGDPLVDLLARPNPFMSIQDMTENLVAHLDLGGNGLLLKVRVRNKPAELWLMRPDRVKPVPSQTDYLSRYDYTLDGKTLKIPPTEVVHFRYVDPANEFWGVSPLMAGGKTVDMEVEAVAWNKTSMANRAVPDGMISLKMPLSEKQFDAANAFLEGQIMSASNAHRPFVMGYDADFKKFQLSPAEMDFIESRKLTREEICGMFAVPPPLVGVYDKATLANIETARVIFWLDTITPLLEDLADVWTFALASDFGPEYRIVYDTSQVQAVQTLLKDRIENAKKLFDMGVPFNVINRRLDLGFDEIVGGEVGFVGANLQPATSDANSTFGDDAVGNGAAVPAEDEEDEDEIEEG